MREFPSPMPQPTEVLVSTRSSLISSGTERYIRKLASLSLVAKARARPDLVRKVVDRARQQGISSTLGAVRSQLSQEMSLGYSAAGVVLEVGEHVQGLRPGDRVTTAGAGHSELQAVSGNLAALVPDDVSFEHASFGAVGAIALHGLRLAGVGAGDRVVVIGLGLVGQLASRLALLAGVSVAGMDLDPSRLQLGEAAGVAAIPADESMERVSDWSKGHGADAVIVSAATSSSDPTQLAARLVRDRGVIVVVGVVGMDMDREPMYEKEVTVRVARSFGPGRYDSAYEGWGVDYPPGYVRWTAGRNLAAVVEFMSDRRLEVADLISHRFPFSRAVEAYELLDQKAEKQMAIVLDYDAPPPEDLNSSVIRFGARSVATPAPRTGVATALIGAGQFARSTLVPAAMEAGFGPWTAINSATGAGAEKLGELFDFDKAVDDPALAYGDPETDVVLIASHHDTHCAYVVAALEAGKHVFCEKPLAITDEELKAVVASLVESPGALMVGFNRRWSEPVQRLRRHFGSSGAPLHIRYRVNAGALEPGHWLRDRRMGGRLLGEGCHFVDTCNAIVGLPPRAVFAFGTGQGEVILEDDFTIVLSYPDGSQASITYASDGPGSLSKELVEVVGRGRHAVIDNYHSLTLVGTDGRRRKIAFRPADKGHTAELRVFYQMVTGEIDSRSITNDDLISSQAALAAVRSMTTARAVHITVDQ